MKKTIITLALILSASLGIAGIINHDSLAKKDAVSIDVILKSNSSEYWSLVKAGAESCAEEYGVNIDIKGPAFEDDILDQVSLLKTDIESGKYDAYVIAPSSDLINEIADQTDACFVAMDTNISSEKEIPFVGTDNYEAAKQAAIKAVEMAKLRGFKVIDAVCIAGVPGDVASEARKSGFADGIKEAGENFINEEYFTNGKGESAVNAMNEIIKNHKDGVAVVFCNNDEMAIEAAKLVRMFEAYKNTIFVGFDGIRSGCVAIKDNLIQLSVGQNAYEIGYNSVKEAILSVNGKPSVSFSKTGFSLIDINNADERIEELSNL